MATARDLGAGNRVGVTVIRGFLMLAALAIGSFFFGFFIIAPKLPGNQPEQTAAGETPPPANDNGSAPAPPRRAHGATVAPTHRRPAAAPPATVNPTIEATTNSNGDHADPAAAGDNSTANPFAGVHHRVSQAEAATNDTPAANDDNGEKPDEQTADTSGGSYRVQIGIFSRRSVAEAKMQDARDHGFDATVHHFTSREGRELYRVQCGPFDDAGAAKSTQRKLKDAGFDDAFVPRH